MIYTKLKHSFLIVASCHTSPSTYKHSYLRLLHQRQNWHVAIEMICALIPAAIALLDPDTASGKWIVPTDIITSPRELLHQAQIRIHLDEAVWGVPSGHSVHTGTQQGGQLALETEEATCLTCYQSRR